MKKLIYFVSEDWYFCSHRLELGVSANNAGFDVYVMCNVSKHGKIIEQAGLKVIPLDIDRSNTGIYSNVKVFFSICRVFRNLRPDLLHNVAQKPVILGSIAAYLCGVPKVINALGGLGFIFISKDFKAKILKRVVSAIYKILFNSIRCNLIVQNKDDFAFFVENLSIQKHRICLIRGAGINIDSFPFQPLPPEPIKITLVARMLKDKGVFEFIEAAKLLQADFPSVVFQLVGNTDSKNPNSFSDDELNESCRNSNVRWLGRIDNILSVWKTSHIAVLPSYREGLPKSLLEAASVGRPIVTTDVPGCREVVIDGFNGYLVRPYSSKDLANKLSKLLTNTDLLPEMGLKSRELTVKYFSSVAVNNATLKLYE